MLDHLCLLCGRRPLLSADARYLPTYLRVTVSLDLLSALPVHPPGRAVFFYLIKLLGNKLCKRHQHCVYLICSADAGLRVK